MVDAQSGWGHKPHTHGNVSKTKGPRVEQVGQMTHATDTQGGVGGGLLPRRVGIALGLGRGARFKGDEKKAP